jgi:hypothetical protein
LHDLPYPVGHTKFKCLVSFQLHKSDSETEETSEGKFD